MAGQAEGWASSVLWEQQQETLSLCGDQRCHLTWPLNDRVGFEHTLIVTSAYFIGHVG